MEPRNPAVHKSGSPGGEPRKLLSVRSALVLGFAVLVGLGGAALLYVAHRPIALVVLGAVAVFAAALKLFDSIIELQRLRFPTHSEAPGDFYSGPCCSAHSCQSRLPLCVRHIQATMITSRDPAPLHLCGAPFVIARRQNVSASWFTTGDEVGCRHELRGGSVAAGSEGLARMWAHSLNAAGVRHSLTDHLHGTAELAGGFAAAFGARDAGYFLGLAHDAGKASCSWQEHLAQAEKTGGRVGVDHKTLGVYLADSRGLGIAQFALHGHHGGLTCRDHIGRKMREERADGGQRRRAEAEAALRLVVPELFDGTPVPLPPGFDQPTAREFLVRFLFSCLVDADALDTQAHRFGETRPRLAPAADFSALTARFEHRRAEFLSRRDRSPAGRWRDTVYESCVAAAGGPGGLYRLAAPTGSGKTLAAAAFALRHAALHGKARVIVAVPFITITEQNAGVYRRLLDPGEPASSLSSWNTILMWILTAALRKIAGGGWRRRTGTPRSWSRPRSSCSSPCSAGGRRGCGRCTGWLTR